MADGFTVSWNKVARRLQQESTKHNGPVIINLSVVVRKDGAPLYIELKTRAMEPRRISLAEFLSLIDTQGGYMVDSL